MAVQRGNSVLSPQSSVLAKRPYWTFSRRGALTGYLLVVPVCFVLLMLVAYPFGYAIEISFTSRVVGSAGKWVGFQNFRYLWNFISFKKAVTNTIVLVIVSDGLKFVIGLSLALLLNEKLRARNLFRGFILLPWAMPGFVAFLTWRLLFQPIGGGINLILTQTHIHTGIIDWLGQKSTAMPAVIAATVWRGFPFWCISFLAALQNVPQEQYEAAKTDGANAWQRFWFITLPSIRHVILVVALLSSIWTANSFENIYLMTQGGPSDATMVLPVLAFFGLQSQRLGEAAAVSVAIIPALAVLVFIVAALLQKD
ncbi:MAG: carbohydrate ABC transporter permease [Thermomicrobiales bacterium]